MKDQPIIAFGLSNLELEALTQERPSAELKVIRTDEITDVIAIPAVAIIVNAAALSQEDRSMLTDFYLENRSCYDETIIWYNDSLPPQPLTRNFYSVKVLEDSFPKLKYLLLTACTNRKKALNFSKKVSQALMVLYQIRKNPGISTKRISELTEINERTVIRCINALQVAGEWIEFDHSCRGWKLQYGKSIFLDFMPEDP